MCGVTGLLVPAATPHDLEETVFRMTDALRHRGPDDGGVWLDPAAGVALGHRRLSILDLSPNGRQPMFSASGRYVVTFNGEIYNHAALRRQLAAVGHTFRGHSDTEVLLAAVEEWGLIGAVERANGMFALGLWDTVERRLYLTRDRLGEKPLYYGRVGGAFAFASELKALRAHPAFDAPVDRDALALYLQWACVPAPASIYAGILKLPPGTILSVDASSALAPARPVAYWSLRAAAERGVAEPYAGTPEDAADELDALLRDAVGMRMMADVPLGAFLSGGVDSSTIVALMQAQSTSPVRTFTIGNVDAAYNEATEARAVAAHLGTDHTEHFVTSDEALKTIPQLPTLYDEPFADSSQIPTVLVAQLARRRVTVSLSGDGGDELFGGYNRYLWANAIQAGAGRLPARLRRAAARALSAVPEEQWDQVFRTFTPALPARLRVRMAGDKMHKVAALLGAESREAAYRSVASHWRDASGVVPGAFGAHSSIAGSLGWTAAPDMTRWMMYQDAVTYLPDDILVKLDRATMGIGLEGRVPFLDHRVAEFAWRLPLSMKIRDGRGKWLLRQVLARYVPRNLVERPKMGFSVPMGQWLRGPLRDWAEGLLDAGRLRREGYLDPGLVRRKWEQHLTGERSWHYDLWDVLMFQAWLEQQAGPSGPPVETATTYVRTHRGVPRTAGA